MKIDITQIKELRAATGAGVMEAKEAIMKAKGDMTKAKDWLKQQGQAKATKRAGKTTSAGIVDTYLHMERVGAMVEVNCETDFVARTPEFKSFVHEVAMQVASMSPTYLAVEDIPQEVIKQARGDIATELKAAGQAGEHADKIIAGRMSKLYQKWCLLKQPSIKDPKVTIEAKLEALVSRLGENIQVRRFVRYELGADNE